jgi:UDP-N-acetylglucosamine 2-epimerase
MSEELISNSHKYFCSQSKIAKNFIKSSKFKSKNLNTGNLIFAEVRKKSNKFLLYAVTARDFVNMHFLGCETFFEIFKDLQKLNDIANRKKLNILIKLHPNISYLKNELSKEFFFLSFSNEKIEKLLRKTNVTLSFSSTTIEDSLCSKIPVILIDQWSRFQHCVAEKNLSKKNKAVYYINDIEDLPKVVKNINSSKRINFHDYIFGNNVNFNIKELTRKLLQ